MQKRIYRQNKRSIQQKLKILQGFQQSRQSLQEFVQAIPVPLSITSLEDGRFLAANQKFLDLIEFDENGLIGRTISELQLWQNQAALHDFLALLQREAWVHDQEVSLRTANNRTITALVSAERFQTKGLSTVLISLVDVSSRKKMEEMLQARYDLLLSTGEMSHSLAELLELPQIYERLALSIRQLMPPVTAISISLYDTQRESLSLVFGEQQGTPVDLDEMGLLVPEPAALLRARVNGLPDSMKTGGITTQPSSGLLVPMIAKGDVLGIVQVQAETGYEFNDSDAALLSWLGNTAAVAIQNARLIEKLKNTHQDLDQAYEATLEGWSRALELRDHDTQGHTDRVVEMTVELAKRMGIGGRELENIRRGAQLHDIGKMGIPDHILLKPGPLTEQEWLIMRKHPVYAYEMLSPIPQFREILDIPYCHHERWDGNGYPRRLRQTDIPLAARIFCVVDVWDALSSDRPYRPAWSRMQVLEYIRYEMGRHFDPEIAALFLEIIT